MSETTERPQDFSARGQVVEILDRAGERQTRIVLGPGTVIDVPGSVATDLHLGDRVVVEAVIAIDRVRLSDEDGDRGHRPSTRPVR